MAKLVGVIHENEEDPSNPGFSSRCLARRQLPLTIGKSKKHAIFDVKMYQSLQNENLGQCEGLKFGIWCKLGMPKSVISYFGKFQS